jgi:hypothetical protein
MIMATALSTEPCASTHRGDQAEHHQREIFGRAERLADLGERRREGRDQRRADATGEEGAKRRHRKRSAGAPLARHLVTVDAGDDRGRLARQVDQDRRDRPAILRAIEDAGEHDQPGHRLEVERDRQQHRDRGDRTDAGQHADQRADQGAQEREQQVRGRHRDREAEREILQQLHLPLRPDRDGELQSVDEDAPAERDQDECRKKGLDDAAPARRIGPRNGEQ